jgi:DNA-binding transcriptional regulator YhcF (GntR family)
MLFRLPDHRDCILTKITKNAIFTTVVNMDEFVNALNRVQIDIRDSNVTLWSDDDCLHLAGPSGQSSLRLVRMYRPSSDDIDQQAAPDVLLVLTSANSKVAQSVARYNHLFLPGGGYRIVAPGVALINAAPLAPVNESRQVRLTGTTGVVAETLLLGGQRHWSVQELAATAAVSAALAHRVVTRLEREGILTPSGHGHGKTRFVSNVQALADLWSHEEKIPKPFLSGYLYATSMEAMTKKILEACPDGAIGGVLAANFYRPVLTQVHPPIRIWVPSDFIPEVLTTTGFQPTQAGANLEFVHAKNNPWQVNKSNNGFAKVSSWRAWIEIARAEGRVEELAETLRTDLERQFDPDQHLHKEKF